MRILLIDDHAVVRAGLRRLLAILPDVTLGEAANGDEALAALAATHHDLVVLDLNLPGTGGFVLLERLIATQPGLRVLVLTMHAEPLYAVRAMELGARGYMTKNAPPEELQLAVRRVLAGSRHVEAEIAQELATQSHLARGLTARDLEIMRLLASGQSIAQIAETLGIARKTVANICTAIKVKVGASRTADLVRIALQIRE